MRDTSATPARRNSWQYLLMAGLILILMGGLIGAQVWKHDLTVSGVRIEGNRILSAPEIQQLANVPRGVRLFDMDLAAIQRRVEKNPFVKEASVQRDLPARIAVRIEEREPVAALAGETLLYLDADGMVLPSVRSERLFDLPVITGALPDQDRVPGRTITGTATREALQLLLAAQELDENLFRRISEVNIRDSGDLVAFTADFGVPVVFGRGKLATKLATLDSFWNSIVSGRGAQELASIDVRFANQVVVRWTVENESSQ